jgi:hypothetical protein
VASRSPLRADRPRLLDRSVTLRARGTCRQLVDWMTRHGCGQMRACKDMAVAVQIASGTAPPRPHPAPCSDFRRGGHTRCRCTVGSAKGPRTVAPRPARDPPCCSARGPRASGGGGSWAEPAPPTPGQTGRYVHLFKHAGRYGPSAASVLRKWNGVVEARRPGRRRSAGRRAGGPGRHSGSIVPAVEAARRRFAISQPRFTASALVAWRLDGRGFPSTMFRSGRTSDQGRMSPPKGRTRSAFRVPRAGFQDHGRGGC